MADKLLNDIRQTTIRSDEILYFVEVPNDITAEDPFSEVAYHMALLRATSNTVDSGAEEEDIPDVTTKVAGYAVTSYKQTFTHEGPYLKDDPVCQFERYLIDNLEVGEKATVNLVRHYEFDNTSYRFKAVCKVTQAPGGEAQGKAQIAADYRIVSEPEKVNLTFDKDTGVATVTAVAAG